MSLVLKTFAHRLHINYIYFTLILEREFSIFKNDKDGRKQKRIQSSDADDFRIAFFTRADGWVNLLNAEN